MNIIQINRSIINKVLKSVSKTAWNNDAFFACVLQIWLQKFVFRDLEELTLKRKVASAC